MGQAEGICLEEVIKRLSDNPVLGEKCETDVRPKYRTPPRCVDHSTVGRDEGGDGGSLH